MTLSDGRDALFAVLGGAALMRAFDVERGELLGEWRLPGGSLQFEGLHLRAEPALGNNSFSAFLARDEPAGLFRISFSFSKGFQPCLDAVSIR